MGEPHGPREPGLRPAARGRGRRPVQRANGNEDWRGRIAIAVTSSAREHLITITDNGIGLPKEQRDRLTDPYVTTRRKGTGLGLAIVQKIVEQHAGELKLGDAPQGSRFDGAEISLHLPRPLSRRPRPTSRSKTDA